MIVSNKTEEKSTWFGMTKEMEFTQHVCTASLPSSHYPYFNDCYDFYSWFIQPKPSTKLLGINYEYQDGQEEF